MEKRETESVIEKKERKSEEREELDYLYLSSKLQGAITKLPLLTKRIPSLSFLPSQGIKISCQPDLCGPHTCLVLRAISPVSASRVSLHPSGSVSEHSRYIYISKCSDFHPEYRLDIYMTQFELARKLMFH